MMFEDFNYKLFNKYILIDQNNKDYEYMYEQDQNLDTEEINQDKYEDNNK